MAYLPGFTHDIFISYAHDNNPGAETGAGGRITRLHRLLEERLRELTGRELDIWRDVTLARNQEFDKTIRQAVENSGIFLAVNSTAYRNSHYCKQEIELFVARTQEDGYGLSVVDRKRIFNLLLEDIHYSKWPPSFQGATQYNFFEKTPGDTVTLPAEPESDQFKSEFNVLLRNLCRALRDFKEVIETRRRRIEEPPPPSDQKFTVFLAETSEELRRTIRRRLITELQEKGVRLAESVPPPLESEPHDEKAAAEIKRSHLCVHLFDASPGRDIEDAPDQFFTHRQVELGRQSARAQLIWLPNSIAYEAIAYEPHRRFLQSLENATRDSSEYRFIREPLTPDAVVREILDWRRRHEEALASKNIPSAAVLDAHFQDLSNAIEWLGPRLEKRKVALEINYGEDEPRKNIGNLVDKLKKASRLIMVFGRWKREQFEFRVREALKMCLEEEGRLKPCGIYFAPPHSLGADQRFDFGIIPVQQFDSASLDDALMKWLSEG
jgi:TIR domain-containing protein